MWGGDIRVGWDIALAALVLSFVLSASIAWIYRATYEGLSYQRGFVQTLALGGPVAAMAMLAIGDDIARGLGLVGALTLIRFRATLKDTRDLVFAFASLAIGVACGVNSLGVAVLGRWCSPARRCCCTGPGSAAGAPTMPCCGCGPATTRARRSPSRACSRVTAAGSRWSTCAISAASSRNSRISFGSPTGAPAARSCTTWQT